MQLKPRYLIIFAVLLATIATSIFTYHFYNKRHLMQQLISRDTFFGNPDRMVVRVNPLGDMIAYVAPLDGVLNIFVAPISDPSNGKAITNDKDRGITSYTWTSVPNTIIYAQDTNGDENTHLYQVNFETNELIDITPFPGAKATIYADSTDFVGQIIVGINDRNPSFMDLYRYDVTTKTLNKILQNDHYMDFTVNNQLQVVFGEVMDPETGDVVVYDLSDIASPKKFMTIPQGDVQTTSILGFNASGNKLYFIDSRERDKGALIEMDYDKKSTKVIAQDKNSDISSIITHPRTFEVEAYVTEYVNTEINFIDSEFEQHYQGLSTLEEGKLTIVSRSLNDKTWIVAFTQDRGPLKYYLYDSIERKASFLFTSNSRLEQVSERLNPMHGVVIKSRDGLDMVSYLTVPKRDPKDFSLDRPVPLVMLVHGGPAIRDSWGYNSIHQWLSNRGFAVMSVNYRGSSGFGKSFISAGNGQWGAKMSDDIIDAALWAVDKGITTKDQIAIMGGSYGGYATLVGLTFTPDFYRCGISIVGPSNLKTLIESIPPYWKPMRKSLITRIGGDPELKSGQEFLASRSPLFKVSAITKPLLIGQGANDPRVKQAESDQIVKAMKENSISGEYVLFPDEGHGFAKPHNRLAFNAITEEFLARCFDLNVYEPIGDEVSNSSAIVEKW